MEYHNIAFIGGGNMASSLIQGLLDSGYPANKITVAESIEEKRKQLAQKFSIRVVEHARDVIPDSEIILLAVKPQDVQTVSAEIKGLLSDKNRLLISIVAGLTVAYLHQCFGKEISIVRAMPNTGTLIRTGATGLYAENKVSEDQRSTAESIMRACGVTVWVNHEHDMDTITALSGSGPAYFFLLMDAMQSGAEQLGLPSSAAKILTLQTALGAAKMAMESEIPLDELIKRVSSKGGTTEKAIELLTSQGLHAMIKQALEAAKKRSEELSRAFTQNS